MHILFLFLDGIGLGDADPDTNPFAAVDAPVLHTLSNNKRWLATTGIQNSDRAIFLPLDPRLGVEGRPQSGSSQAAILTGRNIPEIIGRHYGPKPDAETRALIAENNLFKALVERGKSAKLLDAYPDGLHRNIARGKTLPSSIQQAFINSGQQLFTTDDLIAGKALTAEWTGDEWQSHLKIEGIPLYTPQEAGYKLVELSRNYDFAFHSHWLTDYVGHKGPFVKAIELLERFDGVMQGVLEKWNDSEGLIIITSDHGNMEVIGDRKHTENDVPCLIIGEKRHEFANGLQKLTDLYPRILEFLTR